MHSLISKEKIQKKSEEFGFDIIKITEPEIHKKDHRYIKAVSYTHLTLPTKA